MKRKKKIPTIRLDPESPLAKGLLLMLEHKRLRESFYSGEISLDEFNQLLKEKGIKRHYESGFAV